MASIFIARMTYTVPIEQVDALLDDHLTFLKAGYAAGDFLAWGPCEPREGGLVFVKAASRVEAEQLTDGDPFLTGKVAKREIIEWAPRFLGEGLEAFRG